MEIALIVVLVLMAVAILALTAALLRSGRPDPAPADDRLDSLNRGLGEVKADTRRMVEVGEEMRAVLGAPTLRGGLGERMLEQLLGQVLPSGAYSTQHQLRNGTRVDALVLLREGQAVSVDAKFPMESYRRLMEADESGRDAERRQLHRAVKGHVDDIAVKYICPRRDARLRPDVHPGRERLLRDPHWRRAGRRSRLRLEQARLPDVAQQPVRLSAGRGAGPAGTPGGAELQGDAGEAGPARARSSRGSRRTTACSAATFGTRSPSTTTAGPSCSRYSETGPPASAARTPKPAANDSTDRRHHLIRATRPETAMLHGPCVVVDAGVMGYDAAWGLQKRLHGKVVAGRAARRAVAPGAPSRVHPGP